MGCFSLKQTPHTCMNVQLRLEHPPPWVLNLKQMDLPSGVFALQFLGWVGPLPLP